MASGIRFGAGQGVGCCGLGGDFLLYGLETQDLLKVAFEAVDILAWAFVVGIEHGLLK
jgi:hypothetical protein